MDIFVRWTGFCRIPSQSLCILWERPRSHKWLQWNEIVNNGACHQNGMQKAWAVSLRNFCHITTDAMIRKTNQQSKRVWQVEKELHEVAVCYSFSASGLFSRYQVSKTQGSIMLNCEELSTVTLNLIRPSPIRKLNLFCDNAPCSLETWSFL